jgi:2-(1,2-epoxy-1,2-dihydrophenyl)acetyl-CoA isomerase
MTLYAITAEYRALDQLLAEAEGQRIAGSSEDAVEGGMAFLQKRKAEFKGR